MLLIVAGILAVRVGRATAAAVPTSVPSGLLTGRQAGLPTALPTAVLSQGTTVRPPTAIRASPSLTPGVAETAVSAGPAGSGAPLGPSAPGASSPGTGNGLVVHVVGQVARPGVVRLASGARVDDAVAACGGIVGKADLSRVNLARTLMDGEQIVVPARGQVLPPSTPSTIRASSPGSGTGPGIIDLNTADAAILQRLPGVGPVLAERILQWRAQHGRFTSIAELTEVAGIGPALLAKIGPHVRV